MANGRNRKKKIMQLEQDEGTIIGDENLRIYITEYYKGLFGPHEKNHFYLIIKDFLDRMKIIIFISMKQYGETFLKFQGPRMSF